MNFAKWSVRNRVAVNLFTVALLVAGFMAAGTRLKLDLFPDITTNFVLVTTVDVSTSLPEDIERTITVPIEEELAEVGGIKEIRSTSQDNLSTIFLEVDPDITDIDPVVNDIRQAVDMAKRKLPETSEDPVVEKFDIPFPLITFTVAYPPGFDLKTIRPQLDRIERRLKLSPGVSDVLVDGLEDREVWVEVDPYRAQSVGVSISEIVSAVARRNVNTVGGRLDTAGGQRVVRVLGEIGEAKELEPLVVKSAPDGQVIRLRDIAAIKETTQEAERLGRVNMMPAVTFSVVKKKNTDVIETSEKTRAVFAEEAAAFPPEIVTQVVADSTKYVRTRIETVLQNGIQALLLVTFLLMLLLDWRLSLVVAFGLPVSFAGTFLVLYFTGNSINLLSLFAMIMALGMVVDDAVVISENVYRYYESGYTRVQAAIMGTGEVFWPVVGSVSTTVAAFLPLIWGEGIIGKFLAVVPVVVISALSFSLVQAFLVLPSHLADFLKRRRPKHDKFLPKGAPEEEQELAAQHEAVVPRPEHHSHPFFAAVASVYAAMRGTVDDFMLAVGQVYRHLLVISLRWRYLVLGGFFATLLGVGLAVKFGVVKFQLFAVDFADVILVKVELPSDYSIEQTAELVGRLESAIAAKLPPDDVTALLTRVGAMLGVDNEFQEIGTNLAMITVDIDEQNPACRKPSMIERDLRDVLDQFPEFVKASARKEEGGPPVGAAINVEILGPSFATLLDIASDVEARLTDIPGVVDVGNDFPRGKTELQVRVDEERAARLGVDVQAVGASLLGTFQGIEASRLRWGNDEVTIRVKADERFSNDPGLLHALRIKNSRGDMVALGSFTTIERKAGIARIKRLNQERQITVSGGVDDRVTTSAEVNAIIRQWIPDLLAAHPGYTIRLTGENEDTEKSIEAMKFAALVAILVIYALLATITNSFALPFVIMAVIPFGLVGVFIGLVFMGQPLGLMTIMGTIALAGIVVNNSVVFVDFMNRYRHSHSKFSGDKETENLRERPTNLSSWARWSSILKSGQTRFRPIFLTTSTTVVGLMGLAFTTSGQEQFLAPMAQAIVWGLSFATLITMILIPCLYAMLDDLIALRKRLIPSQAQAAPSVR